MNMLNLILFESLAAMLVSESQSDERVIEDRAALHKERKRKRRRTRIAQALLHGQKGHTLRTHRDSGQLAMW